MIGSGTTFIFVNREDTSMKEIILDVAGYAAAAAVIGLAVMLLRNVYTIAHDYLQVKKAKAMEEENELSYRLFSAADNVLQAIVSGTVGMLEQTKAKDLRDQVKAGLADYESLKALSAEALTSIKDQLAPSVTEAIQTNVNDLDAYIKSSIEAQLLLLKSQISAAESNVSGVGPAAK